MQKVYVGVDDMPHNAKTIYIGINNVAKKVKKIYVGVNGIAKLCYTGTVSTEENVSNENI